MPAHENKEYLFKLPPVFGGWAARDVMQILCGRLGQSFLGWLSQSFDTWKIQAKRQHVDAVGMILLHRFDGTPVYINVAHIVSIEALHDTVLTLFGGQKARIVESAREVVDAVHAHAKAMGLPWVHPQLDPAHAVNTSADDDASETT